MNTGVTLESIDRLLMRSEQYRTAREAEFLESIRKQYIRKGSLSPGQGQWFNSIQEKYSEQFVQDEESWAKNWSSLHRAIAVQVARYYAHNPPYFSRVVTEVLDDPENATLSRRDWNKFCENKYALRIRAEYDAPPKFNKGDCVQIRATHKLGVANYNVGGLYTSSAVPNNVANKVGFVIGTNAKPVVRAAKGSKIYQILLAGEPRPMYAHESDLKKAKRARNV
jgi:hypothetical protein